MCISVCDEKSKMFFFDKKIKAERLVNSEKQKKKKEKHFGDFQAIIHNFVSLSPSQRRSAIVYGRQEVVGSRRDLEKILARNLSHFAIFSDLCNIAKQ